MHKILIADDVPVNIKLLEVILRNRYELSAVVNGRQAVQMAAEQSPDLILMDVLMPELDGFEACAQIKSQPATAEIPVIFVTAENKTENVVRGFEVGAVDYLTKPFKAQEVLARVHTHLELKRVRDELKGVVKQLTETLEHVHFLKGLLPICAYCKKIRDDKGYWEQVESYIQQHTAATFTHGICPDCLKKNFPEMQNQPLVPTSPKFRR